MKKIIHILLCLAVVIIIPLFSSGESPASEQVTIAKKLAADGSSKPAEMLASLLELRKSLKEQIKLSRKRLKVSTSETEKVALEREIAQLDKQLSESSNDFERIATGVEPALFVERKPETFSWKDELSSLMEPAVKELKRFTIRARQKTDLKDKITELELLTTTASEAVSHLQAVVDEVEDKQVLKQVKALQPEWVNADKRLANKLKLAKRELAQLEAQEKEVSFVETSKISLRTFFRDRGFYLIVGILTFVLILLLCKLLYRAVVLLTVRIIPQQEKQSFLVRLLYIVFQVLSVVLATVGLFFVLYLAEDWFLLSVAIVFFFGLAWTIRQGLPKLWQQGRLMLNIGSVRENERLILHGVPWKVVSINVFCKLVNPALEVELRVPIEHLIGLASRPWNQDEQWFPCKKGDWVVVGGASRARVVSQSHELVEVVERGGRRVSYPTETFLQACPANLSRNFRLRVPFGVSYSLQAKVTSEIPTMLKEHINMRMEEEGYLKNCLNLQVEFCQANASSLDLLILADFNGKVADICKRLERAIQKWCVECCTQNNWEIPFPQLTVHRAAGVQQ